MRSGFSGVTERSPSVAWKSLYGQRTLCLVQLRLASRISKLGKGGRRKNVDLIYLPLRKVLVTSNVSAFARTMLEPRVRQKRPCCHQRKCLKTYQASQPLRDFVWLSTSQSQQLQWYRRPRESKAKLTSGEEGHRLDQPLLKIIWKNKTVAKYLQRSR